MFYQLKFLPRQLKLDLAEISASSLFPDERKQGQIKKYMADTYFKEQKNRNFCLTLSHNVPDVVTVVDSFENLSIIKLASVNPALQGRNLMKNCIKKSLTDCHNKPVFIKTANPRMATLLQRSGFSFLNGNQHDQLINLVMEYEQREGEIISNSVISYRELLTGHWTPSSQKGSQHIELLLKKMKSNCKDRLVFFKQFAKERL